MATANEFATGAWAYNLTNDAGVTTTAGRWLTGANDNAYKALEEVRAMSAEMGELKSLLNLLLAAVGGSDIPVTGTVHIDSIPPA